jgi:hypothetical protein
MNKSGKSGDLRKNPQTNHLDQPSKLIPKEETVLCLKKLKSRIDLIEKLYNPDGLNLHFDNLTHADCVLFEALLLIGKEALDIQLSMYKEALDQHHYVDYSYDGYWFYDLFQLISRGSYRLLIDGGQSSISLMIVERLVVFLVEAAQITTMIEGDITKRNIEALANLLLAFYDHKKLLDIARTTANNLNEIKVIEFTNSSINWADKLAQKNNIFPDKI